MTDLLRELTQPRSSDTYRGATPLARGGMAVIERVHDTRLRRDVARKLLPLDARRRDLSAAERRRLRRFLDEALVQSHLQHPAILPVHDLGIDERGWPFFTMPIVQGKHFGEVIAAVHAGTDAAWTRERALQVMVNVCEAVSYAHGKGVVHRDLKPENLMIGASGEVLVMDFGLARVRQPATDGAALTSEFATLRQQLAGDGTDAEILTLEGDVVGTPAYMAPEQAAGDLGNVDQFSDQYALGAVLYQLLTSMRPYGDRSTSTAREVVAAVRQKPPTPIHVLDRRVPIELCAICERAMQRDPSARYAKVADLTADLRAFLEQRVVRAHATGWWAQLRTWLRRNRWPAAATLAATVTVIGGVGAVLWVQSAQQVELRASAAALRTQQATSQERQDELRHHLYVSDIGLAQRMHAQRRARAEVRAVLDRCEPSLRGWEWHYLASVEDLSTHTFRHGGGINSLALSEDGTVLGSAAEDGFVKLWDTKSGALRRAIRVGGRVGAIALSADLRHVALCAGDFTVRLHDAATGEEVAQSVKLDAWQTAACFSPDGKLLVTAGNDKQAHVWRLPSLEHSRSHPTADTQPQVLVHPDGERCLLGGGPRVVLADHGYLRIHDPSSPATPPGWQGHTAAIGCMHADKVGRWLFTGDAAGVVHQWDLAALDVPSRQPSVERLLSMSKPVYDIALTQDGSALAAACADDKLRVWRLDGDDQPRSVDARVVSVAFVRVPDGPPEIATLLRDQSLVHFHRSDNLAPLRTQVTPGWAGSVRLRASLDGSSVVLAPRSAWANQCGLIAFEVRTGERVVHDIPVPAASDDLALRADGKQVATADRDGRLRVHELASWRKLLDIALDTRPLRAVAWSPDGKEIAVGGQTGIYIVNAETGALRTNLLGHIGWVQGLAWSHDGDRLFSLGGYTDGQLKVWDPRRAIEYLSLPLPAPSGQCYSIAASADDRVLAISHGSHVILWRLR